MLERFRQYIEDHHQMLVVVFCLFMVVVMSMFKRCHSQTESDVYDYIISSDIQHHKIVFQQVLKETGHLKCEHCSLDHNNLFGFRYNHKYLEFDTWQESIDYYEHWQIRKGLKSDENYYDFLLRKWGAPNMDSLYIPRLKRIKI